MKISRITKEDAFRIYHNQREFSSFLKSNEKFIQKIVHRILKKNSLNLEDSEIFEDAYQEATLSLWKNALPKYNGSTRFSTFAYTVITNSLVAFLSKKTKFESKTGGRTRSIEEKKRAYNNNSEIACYEYIESDWVRQKTSGSVEDFVISKIDEENLKNKMNPVDFKITELRKRGWDRAKIAQALKMNLHTYKNYYYSSYVKKIKEATSGK